jgi:hypothetical protein
MKMNSKVFFISVLIILSIVVSTQTSLAFEFTKAVSAGLNNLEFRDISNSDPAPAPTLSLDQNSYRVGNTAILTLNDEAPNVDLDASDFAYAIVGGSSLTLTETDDNTGVFTGSFLVVDPFPTIDYLVDPDAGSNITVIDDEYRSGYARLSTTLDISNPGSIEIKDVEFTDDDFINLCFRPVLEAVEITPVEGAILDSTDSIVTINYANAIQLEDDQDTLLQMYYKKPGFNWQVITPNIFVDAIVNPSDAFANDIGAQTITSDPIEAGYGDTISTGLFTVGYETGCGGGGGGGLVRPSLVVNALAGIGGAGGGGSAYSSPQLQLSNMVLLDWIDVSLEVEEVVVNHDSRNPATSYDLGYFEDFNYPLVINDKGFILSGFTTTLETQTLKINTPHTIKFLFYESEIIQHFSLYTNLRDATDEIHESDTQILYNANQELQVVDPNTVNELDDNKKEVVLEFTFAKTMDTSHVIIRSWDPNFYSGDTHILNAWEIVSDEIIESPITTYEEPVIENLQSATIPIWIKNNAAWWSEQQIDDSDFVAGIEYLITNGIITVPGVEVGATTTSEIPDWIKNNAGWWADSLITDEDFTEAMQWLVANGVIQI